VGIDETPRIVNIATRARISSDESSLIAGFIVAGSGAKRVTVRAVGPTLGNFGVTDFLADPVLSVYNSSNLLIYTNDDWATANDFNGLIGANSRLGAFPLPSGSADAAGILTLEPGSYTAVVTRKGNATGVALVEVYEDDNSPSRLINVSSRASVGAGSAVVIPGFVTVGGTASKRLLMRAVGPGLSPFGVGNVLLDPAMTVTNSAGLVVASNDNWQSASNLAELVSATGRLTFPLGAGSRDAALLVSLPPGGYTVQVTGVGNTSGNVLVEVYEVP
jgi:hypothetical protein